MSVSRRRKKGKKVLSSFTFERWRSRNFDILTVEKDQDAKMRNNDVV